MKTPPLRPPRKSVREKTNAKPLQLTHLSSCAGCAAKLSQTLLAQVLAAQGASASGVAESFNGDRNVLVGSDTFDDAGVYRLSANMALVQTVDFFTPIVDDPYDFGQIAAANAISDVYAMGGRPITALNLLGVPADRVPPEAIAAILCGGGDKAREAHCPIIGGHTIRVPEPIFGLSVTGLVHPRHILTNAKARPGDLLILTKPLGTGIATTAIKRGLASRKLALRVTQIMKEINFAGAELGERGLVKTATDVTGFGLMGHLGNIVRASGVGAQINAADLPSISAEILELIERDCIPGGTRSNADAADEIADWSQTPASLRWLLCDAQTSGGLLLCVAPKNLEVVKKVLSRHSTSASAVIGRIIRCSSPRILVLP